MAKIQLCRNNCGQYIVLQEDMGKWKPYDSDDVGNPIQIHQCPNNPYYAKQQGGGGFQQKKSFTSSPRVSSTTTSGGETLDTKRLLQAVMENTKAIQELQRIIDSRTVLDTSKYEQRINQIYNVIAPLLNKETFKTAAADRQDIMDTSMINHSKIADQNYDNRLKKQQKGEITDADIPDSDEFETTKKFVKEDEEEDFEDLNNKDVVTEDF